MPQRPGFEYQRQRCDAATESTVCTEGDCTVGDSKSVIAQCCAKTAGSPGQYLNVCSREIAKVNS